MAKGKPSKSADFFISYATSDEAMAREIGSILDGAGYSYVAQFRDFVVGKNFVREMQRGLAASSRLIALLSPAYERSDNCQSEWSAAYAQDPGSRNGKIIPLKIAEVELNPLAGQIVYKSIVGLDAAARRVAVLEAIGPWMKGRSRSRTAAARSSGIDSLAAHSLVPPAAKPGNLPVSIGPLFKGREKFLRQLRESFRHKAAAAITGKAVHGLGGVGKTRAAIEYGHVYSADYAATFFLVGKSERDLKDSLAALAGRAVLDLPERDLPDLDARLAAVIRWLRTNPGWLLIIDNVDDKSAAKAVRQFLDQVGGGGGHLLITSRVSDWAHVVEPLELNLLSVGAAKDLLRESTPRRTTRADEDAALTRLADEQLGCLSLALVQAAAHIQERRIGFADYSALFEREAATLLAKLGEAATRDLSYPLPVALTWQTSIAQLGEAGRLLLDMLAWLSIEPIPRSLFDSWPKVESFDLEEGLAQLTRYSFVHWEAENSAIALHRLVAQVTRDNQDNAARDRALGLLFPWLEAVNPEMNAGDVRCWPQLMPLLPHAISLFARTRAFGPYPLQARVYDEYATLLESLARYSDAEPLFRRALEIDETIHGSDSPSVAIRLNNLAGLLSATSRLTEAEPLYRRALAINEAVYPDNNVVAASLNNLAELLTKTNRLAEAELLYRRALAAVEEDLGPHHPFAAICLSGLAGVLQDDGKPGEAEPLYRRALAIDEASHGLNHPKVAIRLSNLAGLLGRSDAEEAEALYRRALMIFETSYGPDHPTVATCTSNLAVLLGAIGRQAEAEPLYRRAIAITEASYGPVHPHLALRTYNLAMLLAATSRLEESLPLFSRAALIYLRSSRAFGHLLPNTAVAIQEYAYALSRAGEDQDEAHAVIASLMTEAGFDAAELWQQVFEAR